MGTSQRRAGLRPPRCGVAVMAWLMGASVPALAFAQVATAPASAAPEGVEQMRAELRALQAEEAAARAAEAARAQRISALAQQLGVPDNAPPPIETIPATAEAPTPIQTSGPANRRFEVYGAVQLDYIQDFNRVAPNWEATLRPSRIPTTQGEFGSNGQSVLSARQTRFGVLASQDVAGNPLLVKFEFDLFGTGVDEGQTTFRLRQAYGTWGPLLIGQTNSNWMDGDTFPNVIDYWGPNGMVFVRTPQVRYTYKLGPHEFAVAIEHAPSDIDPGNIREIDPGLGASISPDEKIPDFTGHYRYDGGWGHVQLAAILRRVGFDTPAAQNNEPKGSELGWGVNLSSNIKTWGKDVLHMSAVYGAGIASYMNDGGTDLGPTAHQLATPPGAPPAFALEAETLPLLGLMIYYDHNWTNHLTSSIGYSQTGVDNRNFQASDAYRLGQYASVNLLYAPDPRLLFGAEFLWGERKDKSGAIGDDTRLQFSFKYAFNSNDFYP